MGPLEHHSSSPPSCGTVASSLHLPGPQFLACQREIVGVWGLIKHGSVCKALSTACGCWWWWWGEVFKPQAQPPGGDVQLVCPWGLRGEPLPAGHCGSIAPEPPPPASALAPELWAHGEQSPFAWRQPGLGHVPLSRFYQPSGRWGRVGRKENRTETSIYGALNHGQPFPGSGFQACSCLVERGSWQISGRVPKDQTARPKSSWHLLPLASAHCLSISILLSNKKVLYLCLSFPVFNMGTSICLRGEECKALRVAPVTLECTEV